MQVLINLSKEQKANFDKGCIVYSTNESMYKIFDNDEDYTLAISCKQKEIARIGLLPVIARAFYGKAVCQYTERKEFHKTLDSIVVKFFETEKEGYKWYMDEKCFLTYRGTLSQLEAFVDEDNFIDEDVVVNRLIDRYKLRDHINEEIKDDEAEDIVMLVKTSSENRSRESYTRDEICHKILNWIR